MIAAAFLLLLGADPPPTAKPIDNRQFFEAKFTDVGPGRVDWTNCVLHATANADAASGAFGDAPVVEQQARTRLGPAILQTAQEVRISAETKAGDVIARGEAPGRLLDQELSSWQATETRYHASGRIEIDGQLDLLAWLKPVLDTLAAAPVPQGQPHSNTTGVVVDARKLPLQPSIAPLLRAPSAEVLYGVNLMNPVVARKRTPVLYVTDPADPRSVKRAGDDPIFVRATAVSDRVDIVLDPQDAIRLRTTLRDPWIAAEGHVVIVVDP